MKKADKLPLFDTTPLELAGMVERVIFHNADNGFTVLRLENAAEKASGGERKLDGLQTAVGHMFSPKVGVQVRLTGKYVKNQKFGQQFAFDAIEEILPASADEIRGYLASGLVTGIGSEMARRIVEKFGDRTFDILDNNPELLLTVRGVGQKSLERIQESWTEHRGMRDLMLFLQPHGITAAYAARIFKAYGQEARKIVAENPYRLAMDIREIGFITADSIAAKLGFAPEHPLRIQAAVLYALQKASDDGHVFLPVTELAALVERQVGASADQTEAAVRDLERAQRVNCEELPEVGRAVYLRRFHHCESKTAFYLERILRSPKSIRFKDPEGVINGVLENMDITLAPEQEDAVRQATANKIMVVTGGPGTGKTTIIKAIIKVFEKAGAKILLAAPTGRAAKRMSETSGMDAKTIHRLLEYSPKEDAFTRNEDNPLACHLLIIDEASMMDTLLFYYLLKATPLGATVVLVGDVSQLPSVGPGNVLGDIIDSGAAPVSRLTEIFRQSAESEIICNAHLINRGKMPDMENSPDKASDFYFIPMEDPEKAADMSVDLIKFHIPRRFGFDPVNDIQFLTPMHKGAVGAERMNQRLQAALNPNGLEVRKGERLFRRDDKVMQIRNNYDKDVYNGDIGKITYLNPAERTLSVDFDGMVVPYAFDELDELAPAYAISIHKSQGSEYPAVVIPIMMQHYVLLQRNLIYTAVTRGKKLVVLVGQRKALQIAIRNNKTSIRFTWLAKRLERGDGF